MAVAAPSSGLPPKEAYGTLADGRVVQRYTLSNARGMAVTLLDRGATVASIQVPGRDGRTSEALLTPARLADFVASPMRFGAVVGRYAGRLGPAVTIEGRRYPLAANAAGVTLHGGDPGYDSAIWQARPFSDRQATGVEFRLRSPAGEQSFPGTLDVRVRYSLLRARNVLIIQFDATSDAATVVNLTNHSYYDLSGRHDPACQIMQVDARRYLDTDKRLMPTGKTLPVTGSSLDFTAPYAVASKLAATDRLTLSRDGINDTLVMDAKGAVRVWDVASGRTLVQRSTGPALVIYTANNLNGSIRNAEGRPLTRHGGIALEAQGFPDSPNQPHFPSTLVTPGQPYRMRTTLAFDVDRIDGKAPSDGWRRQAPASCTLLRQLATGQRANSRDRGGPAIP